MERGILIDFLPLGPFVGDQFNAAGWPESPVFGSALSPMAQATSSDSDGIYY